MRVFVTVSLVAIASVFLAFSLGSLSYAPPSSLDGRAVFLISLAIGGLVLGGLGVKEIRRINVGAAT